MSDFSGRRYARHAAECSSIKALDYGLTEKAIEAVRRYRFTPAMKNGEPVSVMITVEVNFKFY